MCGAGCLLPIIHNFRPIIHLRFGESLHPVKFDAVSSPDDHLGLLVGGKRALKQAIEIGILSDLIAQYPGDLGARIADLAWLEQQLGRAVARVEGLDREVSRLQSALGFREQEVNDLREALVLLDGRFAHMPGVVAEGRRVIANIERLVRLRTGSLIPCIGLHAGLVAGVGRSSVSLPIDADLPGDGAQRRG